VRSLLAVFDRLTASARIDVSSTAAATPAQGLVPVSYQVSGDLAGATLELWAPGLSEPAFRKSLSPADGAVRGVLSVHGHLLPNGPHRLTLRLTRAGRTLAERAITVQVRNEGETAQRVAESLRRANAPLVVESCDSGLYDYADASLTAWFDRSPAEIEAHRARLAADGRATPAEIAALRRFTEEGYLVLEDVVGAGHLARLNAALDDAVANKIEGYEWGASQRLHNLHLRYPAIRELWLHPTILRTLELIFEEPARPCQSLTYVFGSEQQHHQDTIHLTPFPAGRMCGVWTALEDVQPDSGELVVFPGSHRGRRVYMKDAGVAKVAEDWTEFGQTVVPIWTDILESGGYERRVYQPKAGTVLIWHENLMHAGQPRQDREKSRRSIVGHYFARGAVVYFDSSGLPGSVHQPEAVTA
jgi:ectoine hydroxylase-related dioxygenase (phytanoyl-CoA dioxygenase family)